MAEDDKDRKGIALLIAQKMKDKEGGGDEKADEGSDYEDLAKEVLEAVESKSTSDLAKALKAFVRSCKGE